MERGTLFQLRTILDRRNISTDVKAHVNAFEDFFDVINRGHIIAAALQFLKMNSLDDLPDADIVNPLTWMEDDEYRRQVLMRISSGIVDKYVDLGTVFTSDSSSKGTAYAYACETLSLTLLWKEFKDAIREGDGNRVMDVWKYLFLIFKSSGRTNYSIEAFTLLVQYHFLLPPMLAEQLKWERFVNCHGARGKNISMDLHMEHLNRLCKTSIQGLGANKSEKAIVRVGKTIGVLGGLLKNFDKDNNVAAEKDEHSTPSLKKDLNIVIKELQGIGAFNITKKRKNSSFKNLSPNLIKTLDKDKLKEWMIERMGQMMIE